MNDNVSERLRELDEEIGRHRKTFNQILDDIGWQVDKLYTSDKMCQCTSNHHHFVPASSFKQHLISCQNKALPPLLTPQEKLNKYEESINFNQLKTDVSEILLKTQTKAKKKDEHGTFLQELQQQRDLKRRRVAYRKKASYTGRKTNTEKMKDLIESMMETLDDSSEQGCSKES